MSTMDVSNGSQLQLAISVQSPSYDDMLESQRELFLSQIGELQNIVLAQCELTGVNPLSQEMAAGALSIKIGKRPRDLLNPKAVKYMQSVFSIKDTITKRESREISALFGVTVTQVREFFMSQRSRVRKFIRVARQKAIITDASSEVQNGTPISMDADVPIYPVPLNCVGPSGGEVPSCSTQYESLPDLGDSDRYFVENIFALMRKEETFAGQVTLMDWILQIHNASLLFWFLTRGGVMVLATWLSQAATEEQTSVLHVIMKVLCHLPLNKALPEHMSAILHSVNRLRFYPASDISNRARFLLSRWSKLFARSQAMKKPNAAKSAVDTHNELLLKQSIDEIMGHESLESKNGCHEDGLALSLDGSENIRKLESPQPLKLLPASADDYSKKFIRGVSSSQTRERRKVLLMEQPGQKSVGRSSQVVRPVPANQSRPLSADDIQKAKLRAQFMQQKYGKTGASSGEGHQVKVEGRKIPPQAKVIPRSEVIVQPQVQEKEPLALSLKAPVQQEASHVLFSSEVLDRPETTPLMPKASVQLEKPPVDKMDVDLDKPLWRKCKRVQIQWHTPAGVVINGDWGVGTGANSKEVEIQKNRIRREKETVYRKSLDIPSDPKEPWDREMDYDDTLTPEIPTEQLPEPDNAESLVSPSPSCQGEPSSVPPQPPVIPPQGSNGGFPEPDLELLAELLKTPELVFALTAGQGGGSLSNEDIVKLLDLIKTNGVDSVVGSFSGLGRNAAENFQVSLPSPTPSSDPVTSGWRPGAAVNPFSRRTTTAYSGGVAATQPPQAQQVLPPPPAANFAPGGQHQPVNFTPQPTAAGASGSQMLQQQPNPDLGGINMRNNQFNRSSLPNFAPESSHYNKPAPVNRQPMAYHHDAAMLRTHTPPRAQPQPPHPPLQRHNPYSRPNNNQHNYNAFIGGPMNSVPPRDGARFQSWGPEDNPNRYNDQMPGWGFQGPGMNVQHNNRGAEPGRWNSSEYREFDRHGSDQRWRDRRR